MTLDREKKYSLKNPVPGIKSYLRKVQLDVDDVPLNHPPFTGTWVQFPALQEKKNLKKMKGEQIRCKSLDFTLKKII